MAVFPTPGSPMRTGLFFFRRQRISTTLSISARRPNGWIEFPLTCQIREVPAEVIQGRSLGFLVAFGAVECS